METSAPVMAPIPVPRNSPLSVASPIRPPVTAPRNSPAASCTHRLLRLSLQHQTCVHRYLLAFFRLEQMKPQKKKVKFDPMSQRKDLVAEDDTHTRLILYFLFDVWLHSKLQTDEFPVMYKVQTLQKLKQSFFFECRS